MFAIGFDLVVREVARHHPTGISSAYTEIRSTLAGYGFQWIQGSLYVTQNEDLANLLQAMLALQRLPWLPASVRDIRVPGRAVVGFHRLHEAGMTNRWLLCVTPPG
jgi:virulence-associated protein VapD